MSISNYLEAAWLSSAFKNTAYTPPTTVYLALYTTDPTDADIGTEVTGGSYARQSVAFGTVNQVSGKATILNSADITFPTASAGWGTVGFVGVRDASTGGNLLYSGAVGSSRAVLSGDIVKFLTGEISIDLD